MMLLVGDLLGRPLIFSRPLEMEFLQCGEVVSLRSVSGVASHCMQAPVDMALA